jgi:hypothetical protein
MQLMTVLGAVVNATVEESTAIILWLVSTEPIEVSSRLTKVPNILHLDNARRSLRAGARASCGADDARISQGIRHGYGVLF